MRNQKNLNEILDDVAVIVGENNGEILLTGVLKKHSLKIKIIFKNKGDNCDSIVSA